MNSAVAEYQLSGFTGLMHRGWRMPTFVRDAEVVRRGSHREIEAEISSGDYFVTVATVLDMLSRRLDDYEVKLHLEDIVSDLIYLQDNYTIVKNERLER
jgi:hypothetical protein